MDRKPKFKLPRHPSFYLAILPLCRRTTLMPELSTIHDYMRVHAALLGDRIPREYPALHQFDDAVAPRIDRLLRTPSPAQTIAIMGVAKRWQQARTAMVVAECGTGKTLISAAGALYSDAAGKVAVLAKTARNAMIGFVALAYAIYWRAGARPKPLPIKPRSCGRSSPSSSWVSS
jgi:hypothetical protein